MLNGKWLPILQSAGKRQLSISFVYRSYHLPIPDPSPSTLTVLLQLQLPTARRKEWRPATADSSPQVVTCQHSDTHYTTVVGLEPTIFRLLVRRATSSSATDSPMCCIFIMCTE